MDKIKQILKQFGLDSKEIALYLSALTLGDSGMTALAKKAGLKRSTAYQIFQSLQQKGLMGSYKMKDGLKFVATNPEILIGKSQKQLEELEAILPQLKAITKKGESKPQITYYEGKEGYLIAAEDSLKNPNSTVYHIGSLLELDKIMGLEYELNSYIPRRAKNNIKLKALYFESEMYPQIKQRSDREDLREIKFLPEKFKHKTSTLIYGNKVAIFSAQKDLITVIIESEEIAHSERQKFDLIWELIG